ncbi:MAG: DUF2934 domain-containing protein [Steroidobacteraceae bacterium]|jgi:hypothetical protein
MIRAEQALHEIVSIGIDEQPEEVLMLKAQALIEKYKADCTAHHRRSAPAEDLLLRVQSDLTKLRDAVDREIDRRVDEDLTDTVCDLLEHLSTYLHEETGASEQAADSAQAAPAADDKQSGAIASSEDERRRAMIAEAAYLRAEQRHFEPGHDLEDWLAAESGLARR